jgi:predicted  nucleic acid-binding Zn-ribbon protein
MYETLDRMRYEAETETVEAFVNARWAAHDAGQAAIDQAHQDTEDDWRLIDEYTYNIRQVRNSLRITKAKLVAERTNASLMVAIKQEMNMGEDIIDINALKDKKQAKLDAETDSTKQQVLTKEIGDLNERLISVAQAKSGLSTTIQDLTAKVTETSALALTIDATIADEEAAIALE